ncbi:MAG: cell division protein ZapA [Pseudomonadota bacterium]
MSDKQAVTVKILDREYRIACEPEEKRQLQDAADYVDSEMRQIRDGSGMVGVEKVAVLVALNIANEFLQVRDREASFGTEVGDRIRKLNALLAPLDSDELEASD